MLPELPEQRQAPGQELTVCGDPAEAPGVQQGQGEAWALLLDLTGNAARLRLLGSSGLGEGAAYPDFQAENR